jgi:serine/threonine protein phosphatase PrpC/LysM repeat protein
MNFNNYTGSDVGQKRKANEDAHGERMTVNGYVFVVCDGMGGHVGGATASQLAVQSILDFFDNDPIENIILGIDKAIKFANEQIYATALSQPELKGMGTTATVLVMRQEGAFIGHVGDSRIYIKSDGKLNRLTKDHSFVQQLVDQGVIADRDAENHPRKNQILRALGIKEDVEATVCDAPMQLKVGDTILMCSDGLSGLVFDARIEQILNENNVQQSVASLINEANNNGGDDNITAAVISITESPYTVSVFKHYNPKNFDPTSTTEFSSAPLNTVWYKRKVFLFGALILLILTSSGIFFILQSDDAVVIPKKKEQNQIEVLIVGDTIKTSIDTLKIYAKDSSILLQEKTVLKDGKYKSSEGWPVELFSGKVTILNNENLRSNRIQTNVKSIKKTKSQKSKNTNDTLSIKPMISVKSDSVKTKMIPDNGNVKDDSLKTTVFSKPSTKENVIHKVETNETLTSIANKYNMAVAELKKMNDLKSDDIQIGQELKVKSN